MLLRVGRLVRSRAGLAAPQGACSARCAITDRPSTAALEKTGIQVTPLSELITDARDRKDYGLLVNLMESLEVMNVQPDEESWNMFVVCMFDLQRADEVFSLIDKMQRRGLPLETFQYNVMIASATKASNLGIVTQLFEKMQQAGVEPSNRTYVSLISACGAEGEIGRAMEYFHMLRNKEGGKMPEQAFAALMNVCRQAQQHRMADEVLDLMHQTGLTPSMVTLTPLLVTILEAGEYDRARELLEYTRETTGPLTHRLVYICLRAVLLSSRGKLREGAYGMTKSLFEEVELRDDAPAFGRVYGTLLGAAIDAREFDDCKRIIRFLDRHELLLPQFARIRLLWLSARDHSLWDLAREEHGGDDVPLSHTLSESALATVSEYWPDDCVEWSAWGVHVIAQLRRNNAVRLLERRTVAQHVADAMVLEHHGLEEVAARARAVAEGVTAMRREGRPVTLGDALLMRWRVPMEDLEAQKVGELAYSVLRSLEWDPAWEARGGAFAHAVSHRGGGSLEELAAEVPHEGAAAAAAEAKRAQDAKGLPPARTWRDLDALEKKAGQSKGGGKGEGEEVEGKDAGAAEGELEFSRRNGPPGAAVDGDDEEDGVPVGRGALADSDEPGADAGVEEYGEELFQPDVHEELPATQRSAADVAGRVLETETAVLSSAEEDEEEGVPVAKGQGQGPKE